MKKIYAVFISLFFLLGMISCQSKKKNNQTSVDSSQNQQTPVSSSAPLSPAEELLEKSIKFHDPADNWAKFDATLTLVGERPNGSSRTTQVSFNNVKETFVMKSVRDSLQLEQALIKDSCIIKVNGSTSISDEQQKKYRLDCKRTTLMRNYYGYLYGLPMKLKDKGTIIDEKVSKVKFLDKEYLSIRVTYEAEVGKDIWYFYFDPSSYALSGYRFYHDETKNDGEYITLEKLETVQGIKMPKIRSWYINKDDKFLGKDILEKGTPQ